MIRPGNSSTAQAQGNTSISVLHTVALNPDRMLLVGVNSEDNQPGDRVVTAITYGGVALTKLQHSDNAAQLRVELWYLLNPAVGTANIAVTMGGACSQLSVGALDVYNAVQVAPEANAAAQSTASAVSASVGTLSGNAMMFSVASGNDVAPFTHGVNQVEAWNITNTASVGTGSYKYVPTISTATATETSSSSTRTVQVVASIRAKHEVTVNDNPTVSEFTAMSKPNFFSVSSSASIAESAVASLGALFVSLQDSILISEQALQYLTTLNFNVLEEHYSLVTEHVDVIDLSVEVGVVAEYLFLSESVSVGLTVLSISRDDSVSLTDLAYLFFEILTVDSVLEDSYVTESASVAFFYLMIPFAEDIIVDDDAATVYIDSLFIAESETFSVSEEAKVLIPTLHISELDFISVAQNVYVSLESLNVFTIDPFHATVTEHVDVIDLSVEVGIVMESVYVLDFSAAYVDVLNISGFDVLAISDSAATRLSALFASANDSVSVLESSAQTLPRLNLSESDSVSLADYQSTFLTSLNVSVSSSSSIADAAIMTDIVIELGIVFEDISHEEELLVIIGDGNLNEHEHIACAEYASVSLRELNVLSFDQVSLVEAISTTNALLTLVASDSSSAAEDARASLDLIPMFSYESVLVSESAKLFDIVIELGVVFDHVSALDIASVYRMFSHSVSRYDAIDAEDAFIRAQMTVYNFIVYDLPDGFQQMKIVESVTLNIRLRLPLRVDSVSVSDSANMMLLLMLRPTDSVAVSEQKSIAFDKWNVIARENVSLADARAISLDVLNFFRIQLLLITESRSIHDITVEVGVVPDFIDVVDEARLAVTPLMVSVISTATVIEAAASAIPYCNVRVNDNVSAGEYADILDLCIEMFVADGVGLIDQVITPGGNVIVGDDAFVDGANFDRVSCVEHFSAGVLLEVSKFDSISVSEYQVVFDRIIELEAFGYIELSDEVRVLMLGLVVFAHETLACSELLVIDVEMKTFVAEQIFVFDECLLHDSRYEEWMQAVIFEVVPRRRIFTTKRKGFLLTR